MAAPTLTNYQQSTWTDTSSGEATASATWSAGSFVVVVGITEDNAAATLNTPTWSDSATFSAAPGTPTDTGSSCKAYAWTATANGAGSGAISSTGTTDTYHGIAVFVFSGSDGLGNISASAALGATTTQSLIRSGTNSAVISIWGDWAAVNDTDVTWTPGSSTPRIVTTVGGPNATFFLANWGDQGAAGTTSYGFSGHAGGGDFTAITIEVLGAESEPEPDPLVWAPVQQVVRGPAVKVVASGFTPGQTVN